MKRDPKQRLEDIDAVFSALAHAARRQIVLTVHFWGGEMTAGNIAGRFGHAWPTTTRHLRVLTDARLLSVETHGRSRVYRLNRARLEVVGAWLGVFERPAAKSAVRRIG
jgi:DNA-binding transcriptional ArsR family regulator